MIEESFAQSMLPFVQELLTTGGQQQTDAQVQAAVAKTLPYYASNATLQHIATRKEDIQTGSVMILPIKNAITKNDVNCGPRGTETMAAWVRSSEADERVLGGVIDFDTPGGESQAMFQLMGALQNTQKPWIAITRYGKATSAGQGIASACDEIFSEDANDVFGSVGTMMTFLNMYESMSATLKTKVQPLYATKSTEKNGAYMAALAGNFKPLQEELLDPMNERFINTIKSLRNITDDGKVFAGKTYYAEEAKSIGLIDRTGATLEEAVARVEELSKKKRMGGTVSLHVATPKSNTTTPKAMSKGFFGLTSTTGIKSVLELLEAKEKTPELLTAAQAELDALNTGLFIVPKNDAVGNVDALNKHIEALSTRATAAETKATELESKLAVATKEVEKLGGKPKSDDAVVEPAAKKDPAAPGKDTFNEDELPWNKEADERLGTPVAATTPTK